MEITSDNNRRVLSNIRRVYKNYDLIKSLAKLSTNVKVINDFYWTVILHNQSPSLSDVCKHLINTYTFVYKKENYFIKSEIFPGKWFLKTCQVYSNIIRREFNKKTLDSVNYDLLFIKYQANKLFATVDVFRKDFEEFYEHYCSSEDLVKILDRNLIFESLKQYHEL